LDLETVYKTHGPTVARWAARLGGPSADVEDIVQEVFLIVDARLRTFRRESRLSTWLFGITANVVANDRRRRRFRRWWMRLTPNVGDDVAATADTPLEQLEKRERRREFYEVLDGLSEGQRRVLVLFELDGRSVAETAELTGMRPSTVRVLLHRGRSAFLKKMTARELREVAARRECREGEE
jgi:RNA polymerase sigma-70 factor (ECF subfamily)